MSRNNLILYVDTPSKDGLYVFDREKKTAQHLMGNLKSSSAAVNNSSYPTWASAYGGYLTSDGENYDHVRFGETIEKFKDEYWFVRNTYEDQNGEMYLIRHDVGNSQNPRYPTFRLDDDNEYMMTYTINQGGSWSPSYAFLKRVNQKHWKGTREWFREDGATFTYRPMFISQASKTVYFLKMKTYDIIGYVTKSFHPEDMSMSVEEHDWTFNSDDDTSTLQSYSTHVYPGIKMNGSLSEVVIMKDVNKKLFVVTPDSFTSLSSSSELNTELNNIIISYISTDTTTDFDIIPLPGNKFWIVANKGYNTVVEIQDNQVVNKGSIFDTIDPDTCTSGMVDLYSGLAVLQYLDTETNTHKIFEKTKAFETNVKEINYSLDESDYVKVTISDIYDVDGNQTLYTGPFSSYVNMTQDEYESDKILAHNGTSNFLVKKNCTLNFGSQIDGYMSSSFTIDVGDTDVVYRHGVEKAGDILEPVDSMYYVGTWVSSDYYTLVVVMRDDYGRPKCMIRYSDITIDGTTYLMFMDDGGMYSFDESSYSVYDAYRGEYLQPYYSSGIYQCYCWSTPYNNSKLYTTSESPSRKDSVWYAEDYYYYPEKIGSIIASDDMESSGFKNESGILIPQNHPQITEQYELDYSMKPILVSMY